MRVTRSEGPRPGRAGMKAHLHLTSSNITAISTGTNYRHRRELPQHRQHRREQAARECLDNCNSNIRSGPRKLDGAPAEEAGCQL